MNFLIILEKKYPNITSTKILLIFTLKNLLMFQVKTPPFLGENVLPAACAFLLQAGLSVYEQGPRHKIYIDALCTSYSHEEGQDGFGRSSQFTCGK